MTEQRAERVPRPSVSREEGVLLVVAIAPGFLALLAISAEYALVEWACRQRAPAVLHAGYALALLLTIGSGAVAWRRWRALDTGERHEVSGHGMSGPFLAFAGVLAAIFFVAVIVALWIPAMVIPPCQPT